MIFEQFRKVLKAFSPANAQHEALVAIDFKKEDERSALMQMCFSVFANWPVVFVFLIFFINPLRYQFSVHRFFESDGKLLTSFYSENFFLGFIIFLFLQSVVRSEILWLSVVGWLISNGDIHVLISVGAVSGLFFASTRRNLKFIPSLKNQIRKLWIYFSVLQLISFFVAAVLNYYLYFSFKNLGYFNLTMNVNRYEFFIVATFINHFILLIVTSLWGHIYSQRTIDPSDWKSSYSTAQILSKLSLGSRFKFQLKKITQEKLNEKSKFKDIRGIPDRLIQLSTQETEYLTSAQTYLE